ncbi:MAG: hypothetical protein HYV68_02855 [Candidatus Taylorbacteria bacterium]|nr:hypothetical protein [Candidatus Taylorbacteria bacterium]
MNAMLRKLAFALSVVFILAICDLNPLFLWPPYKKFWLSMLESYPFGLYAAALAACWTFFSLGLANKKRG